MSIDPNFLLFAAIMLCVAFGPGVIFAIRARPSLRDFGAACGLVVLFFAVFALSALARRPSILVIGGSVCSYIGWCLSTGRRLW
jgi:hypothetical protein